MSIKRSVGALALSAGVFLGCGGPGLETETAQSQHAIRGWAQPNSSLAIGGMMRDVPIRGVRLSGGRGSVMSADSDTAAPIDGITIRGDRVLGLTAPNGRLQATTANGTINTFPEGAPLVFQIGAPFNGQLRVYLYQDMPSYSAYVTEFAPEGRPWEPFCPHEYVGNINGELVDFVAEPMIPVGGAKWSGTNGDRIEDSRAITLSCRHDAVGGCVSWGYAPWDSVTFRGQTVSLLNHHQTCTRLKRADFCGNGVPHTTLNEGTKKNTTIEVWDSAGIHAMGVQTLASMEAYWDVNGATCVNTDRFRTNDSTNSQFSMLADLHSCPKPRCSSLNSPLLYMMGSALP